MKTQTLEIEIPDGFLFDSVESGKIKFKPKPKNVIERIKIVQDVLADHGLSLDEFNKQNTGLSEDEVAYRVIKLLAKSLNEGWVPDWTNSSEYKYFPWFEMRGSSGFRFNGCDCWIADSSVGSRLCFKSRALAEHAGTYFKDTYEKLMVIK